MLKKIKELKAVTMVETAALLLPIIIFFGFLIVGGQMVNNKLMLNYAVQQATRAASLQNDSSSAYSQANEVATELLRNTSGKYGGSTNTSNIKSMKVDLTPDGSWERGNDFTVTITITYESVFAVPNGDGSSITGTKTMTMKSSQTSMIETTSKIKGEYNEF